MSVFTQDEQYIINDIGILSEDGAYGLGCSGTFPLKLNVESYKHSKRRLKNKGSLEDKYSGEPMYFYTILLAKNDTVSNRLEIIKVIEVANEKTKSQKKLFDPDFKINVKLEPNVNVYFGLIVGYSSLELKNKM